MEKNKKTGKPSKPNGYSECADKAYATSDEVKKQFAHYLYQRECNEVTGEWTCPNCPFNKECNKNLEAGGSATTELCEVILGQEAAAGIRKRTAERWEAHMNNPNGVYYIENTIDEIHTKISGYFKTFGEAMDGLKDCADWFRDNGTGKIYFQEYGFHSRRRLVYEAR